MKDKTIRRIFGISAFLTIVLFFMIFGGFFTLAFTEDQLDYYVLADCSKLKNRNAFYEPYYPTSSVSKLDEPWSTYSKGYTYCELNGYAGTPKIDPYSRLSCQFESIPMNDRGNCAGTLTYYKVQPVIESEEEIIIPDPEIIEELYKDCNQWVNYGCVGELVEQECVQEDSELYLDRRVVDLKPYCIDNPETIEEAIEEIEDPEVRVQIVESVKYIETTSMVSTIALIITSMSTLGLGLYIIYNRRGRK